MLVASRHPQVSQLVVVVDDTRTHAEGNVVYRWNETHQVGTRTRHGGPRPTMAAIRAAIDDEASVVRDPAAWRRVAAAGRRFA